MSRGRACGPSAYGGHILDSKQSLIPRLFLAGFVVMFSHVAFGQDGFVQQRPKVISLPSAENVKELYVAIMGEVIKPGTYHLDSTSLKLQSVVQRAGGLTSEASPTIRVVRQGRVTQKEVYSDHVSTPVFPGDLLVVEAKPSLSKHSNQFTFNNEPSMIHARYEERSDAAGVQIALVNLVDYPLVLKLHPDDASAVNIVERLGQPIELLANTYIITPDKFPRSTSEEAKHAIRLAQGSVMVFDRDRVNRNRLPSSLPQPIESEIAMGAQPGLIGSPWGQSPELRNLGQRVASGSPEANEFREQFERRMSLPSSETSSDSSAPEINENQVEVTPSNRASKPRIANLPFTGTPRIKTSSSSASQSDQPTSDSIPQPDDSANESSLPSLAMENEPSPGSSAFSGIQLFILIVVVSTLVAGALLLRRVLESNSVNHDARKTSIPEAAASELPSVIGDNQTQSRSLLERLIKNELPISIESIAFPAELILQGKIAAQPILRVDGPQSILKQNGPHFGSSTRSAGASILSGTIAQVDSPEAGAVRRPHFIDNERQKSSIAAASSPVQQDVSAGASDDQQTAPLAKALFQLEQGGRS